MAKGERKFKGVPVPPPDKSKWTGTYKPLVPADPEDVKAFARAVRAKLELWQIFLDVKPDEWIAEEDGVKVSIFAAEYDRIHGTRIRRGGGVGTAKQLLRALAEGTIKEI